MNNKLIGKHSRRKYNSESVENSGLDENPLHESGSNSNTQSRIRAMISAAVHHALAKNGIVGHSAHKVHKC
jgi:hypothetical protein